jgi:2-amino-4-hydroxy-6-hydroxymethyldihydropteridine diphosphokinase
MDKQLETAYIGIGSNLGNRGETIKRALNLIKKNKKIQSIKTSTLIETTPTGYLNQPRFINGVSKISTKLTPLQLLRFLKSIELRLGRTKSFKNGPRAIDLDILLYGKSRISTDDLTIPHPRMFKRQFVLAPLKQLLKVKNSFKIKNFKEIKKLLE